MPVLKQVEEASACLSFYQTWSNLRCSCYDVVKKVHNFTIRLIKLRKRQKLRLSVYCPIGGHQLHLKMMVKRHPQQDGFSQRCLLQPKIKSRDLLVLYSQNRLLFIFGCFILVMFQLWIFEKLLMKANSLNFECHSLEETNYLCQRNLLVN